MNKKLKRWLGIVVGILAVCFVLLNVIAYRQAYVMLHFTKAGAVTEKPEQLGFGQKLKVLFCGVNLPRPHSTLAPDRLGPSSRSFAISESNGMKLGAWYCPASDAAPADHPLIILFHGYHGEKTSTIKEAKVFLELGLSVLLVDFRGSGESSETYTTVGHDEAEDVAAAANYCQTNLPHSKLILYGISMGAASVLRAVDVCGVKPDAIIAEAVFDRMLATVKNRFDLIGVPSFPGAQLLVFWGGCQFGFNGFGNNPIDFAQSVRCPILFLHGADDSRARLAEARNVYDAVPGQKWFKEFPQIGHEAIVGKYRRAWQEAVSRFLKDAKLEATRQIKPSVSSNLQQ